MSETQPGSFSSIFGETSVKMVAGHQQIAEKLIEDGFILTALEFHTELLESGKELKTLKDFFSNSKNFSCSEDVINNLQSPETPAKGFKCSTPGKDISRSGSQMTLDSIDQLTRYSEDTDRRDDDRVAILEYELRTARETIFQLRAELSEALQSNNVAKRIEDEDDNDEEDIEVKPYEKKFLNFVVNDYLLRNGYKFTAITFSDECDGQNLDDAEEIGITTENPPSLLNIFRNFDKSKGICSDSSNDADTQTEESTNFKEKCENLSIENENLKIVIQQKEEDIARDKNDLETLEIKCIEALEKVSELENERVQLQESIQNFQKEHLHDKHNTSITETSDTNSPGIEREDGDGASLDEPQSAIPISESSSRTPLTIEEYIHQNSPMVPRPISQQFQKNLYVRSFPVNIPECSSMFQSQNNVIEILAKTLPNIVANLVLSSRSDIVPLLIHCIHNHSDKKTRDNLISLLFNLMKKPDEAMQNAICSGLFWLVNQSSWTFEKIEEEILPHLLEQINLKYVEKKILVGKCIGVLAFNVEIPIRSSLLVSLCLQLLEMSNTEVVISGIRALSILINIIDDTEKIQQVYDLVKSSMQKQDQEEDVKSELKSSLLPVLNAWLIMSNSIFDAVNITLNDIENIITKSNTALSNEDPSDIEESIKNTESLLQSITFLHTQMPYCIYQYMKSCPAEKMEIDENFHKSFILGSIFGENENYFKKFSFYTLKEWFKTWKEHDDFLEIMSRLTLIFKKISPNNYSVIKKSSILLSSIIEMIGYSSMNFFKKSEESLTTLQPIIFYAYFIQDDEKYKSYAMNLLRSWFKQFSNDNLLFSYLQPSIRILCAERKLKTLLENLFLFIRDEEEIVRLGAGNYYAKLLLEDLSEDEDCVTKLLVPALLSLSVDNDIKVRKSSVTGIVSLVSLPYLDLEVMQGRNGFNHTYLRQSNNFFS